MTVICHADSSFKTDQKPQTVGNIIMWSAREGKLYTYAYITLTADIPRRCGFRRIGFDMTNHCHSQSIDLSYSLFNT